jgi:cobalt/nickel transport system permease protein
LQELYRSRDSILHAMDARVKLLITLAFIFSVSLSPHGAWPAYILFFSLALAMAQLSRLGLSLVYRRSLLALPFLLAALPLVFTGPAPRYALIDTPTLSILYSPAGVERFFSIAVKSWISVQAAVLLAATTPFTDLLSALRQLGVPRLLVSVTGLMWRYLFVMFDEVQRMLRRAQQPQRRTGGRDRNRWKPAVAGARHRRHGRQPVPALIGTQRPGVCGHAFTRLQR